MTIEEIVENIKVSFEKEEETAREVCILFAHQHTVVRKEVYRLRNAEMLKEELMNAKELGKLVQEIIERRFKYFFFLKKQEVYDRIQITLIKPLEKTL